jgi:two-component system response regulator GlrR
VISDLVMDEMDGLKLVQQIHERDPVLPIMIVSGQARIADALNAANLGVTAFLEKPVKREHLLETARDILSHLTSPGQKGDSDFASDFVHRSAMIGDLLERSRLVAEQNSPALILGPTGSGKKMLAQAIHQGSPRREKPFLSIQCGSLPQQLLESELFGHVKGAFPEATEAHTGLFQSAQGGTLFLDEVGDMPLEVQGTLQRVLENLEVRPLGANEGSPVDVHLIASSSQDLQEMVANGDFRENLFYRLNVVPLKIPPLSQRLDDIPVLIEHFLNQLAAQGQIPRKRFSPDALRLLVGSDWPGNVRQLRNVVEHCHVLTNGRVIPLNLVEEAVDRQSHKPPTLDQAKMGFERRYLASLLRTTRGNVTDAARLAGRNRTEFYKLLHRHELNPADFRAKH